MLSFAGEDRSHAEAIARAAKKRKLRVFYDKDFYAHLWGKNQEEYERIYGPAGRFFVPLISQHYPKKDWTQLELSFAKKERRQRTGDHFLPIKIDDTTVLGIPDDLNYLSIDQYSPEDIAAAIAEKCRPVASAKKSKSTRKPSSHVLALLNQDTRRALSLIASASLPVTCKALQKLFRDVEWEGHLRKLRRAKLIETKHRRVVAVPEVIKELENDEKHWDTLNAQWIEALEPLKAHVDLCLSLSLHYVAAQRFDEAVELLTAAVGAGDLGFWNSVYRSALGNFLEGRAATKIARDLRLEVCNGIALCYLRDRRYVESIPWLEKLRDRSKRAKNDYWLGQAFLNLGIAHAELSNRDQSSQWYRKAEQHGKDTGDNVLVGRALGNLSQILVSQNIHESRRVLDESFMYKRKAKDHSGLAIAEGQLARLLVLKRDYKSAIGRYRKAIKRMEALGLWDDRILAQIHLGLARSEAKQKAGARNEFRKAAKLADEYQIPELHKLALSLEAQVSHELTDLPAVQSACSSLLRLAKDTEDAQNEICAIHGLGVAHVMAGRVKEGRRELTKALNRAAQIENRHWVERCGVDLTREIRDGRMEEPNIAALRRRARRWEKKGKDAYAADLWIELGDHLHFHNCDPSKAIAPYRLAADCYAKASEVEDAVLALARIADCHEHLREYAESLDRLAEAEELAKSHSEQELAARAMNQRAVLLEELDRFSEATSAIRKAITIQRKLSDKSELQTSLHNLGEVLRNAEKYTKSLEALEEAEALARSLGDIESALSSMHSRGLVLEHMGDEQGASRLFQACRSEAQSEGIWKEYVRSWEAMANLAWCQKKRSTAITRYRRALADAKKYGCTKSVRRTALNLANALYWVGQLKRAQKLLETYDDELSREINSYMHHARLADIHEACEEQDKALERWRICEESANAAGNAEYIAYCAAGTATNLQAREDYSEAEEKFRVALEHEHDPEDRVILLSQLLDNLLEQGSESEANSVFSEAVELARAEGFYEHIVDLHMSIFDRQWHGGREEKLEALKAWSVAVLESFHHEEVGAIGSILGHVIGTLTTEKLAPSKRLLAGLRRDLESWLDNLFPSNRWATDFLLAQLDIVDELLPFVGEPRQLARRGKEVFAEFDKKLAE